MAKIRKYLSREDAVKLGLEPKENLPGRNQNRYSFDEADLIKLDKYKNESISLKNKVASHTQSNDYSTKKPFVLSAWNKKGFMMDIDQYCDHYKLPRKDISSYKLVSHTGTPFYNIVFKEKTVESDLDVLDVEAIVKKYAVSLVDKTIKPKTSLKNDFDVLTYTDVHIGMDTDKFKNTMYKNTWNKSVLLQQAKKMVNVVLMHQKSNILIVDDLGDLLDGFDGKTTRKGHDLPQNMTNEEAFDAALEFKLFVLDNLVKHYSKIIVNNICNDNHAGAFGYFVNKAVLEISKIRYKNVDVVNHRQFINHYFVKDICFIITHGKDDKSLKFGFKVHLDSLGVEKIDQYCKRKGIYSKAKLIVFKKGDSHQALFDFCTSDDFYYFNYPAFSPSSNWIKNNFKLGRRGFALESYKGVDFNVKPFFFKNVG